MNLSSAFADNEAENHSFMDDYINKFTIKLILSVTVLIDSFYYPLVTRNKKNSKLIDTL